MAMHNNTRLMTLEDFAEFIGVTYKTICNYKALGLLPEPDKVVFRSPLWKPSTARKWYAARPGRGAGGGRPRKVAPTITEENHNGSGPRRTKQADIGNDQ